MFLKRFELIEVPIPSGSANTRFYFPDAPQLRNASINAIQIFTVGAISATPNTGSTPVSTADLKKSSLTLYSGDIQLVYNAPVLAFNSVVSYNSVDAATNPYVFLTPDIQGLIISWTKSYIQLASAPSATGVAYSFGVYYTLPA